MVVRVGPFQRIVGVNWPSGSSYSTQYIVTEAYVVVKETYVDGDEGDDGVPRSLWNPSLYYPGYFSDVRWIRREDANFLPAAEEYYFRDLVVYDALGNVIAAGTDTDLGATVTRPAIPQITPFSSWELDASYSATAEVSPPTVPVDNPVGLFYVNGGTAQMNLRRFKSGPTRFNISDEPPTYYKEFGEKGGTGEIFFGAPVDLTSVSISLDGISYLPIGFSHSTNDGSLGFYVRVLLKSVETSA